MDSIKLALPLRLYACLVVFWAILFRSSLGSELTFVTCGSALKLLNVKHNVRLHSHDVRYGSGQSLHVTRVFRVFREACGKSVPRRRVRMNERPFDPISRAFRSEPLAVY